MLVVAIDVGSPPKMGWASSSGLSGCGDPAPLIEEIATSIERQIAVSIGFESPLWVPRSRAFAGMTKNRGRVESSMGRPWSAGAGCGALAAGIANMAWIFEAIFERTGSLSATTQPERFKPGNVQLYVWEAFVSGAHKSDTHQGDAELAIAAFTAAWPQLDSAITTEQSVNLPAAALCATGHRIAADEFGMPGVVVAALGGA